MVHFCQKSVMFTSSLDEEDPKTTFVAKKVLFPNHWFYIRLAVKTELRPDFAFLFSDFAGWLDRGPDADINVKKNPKQNKLQFMLFSCLRAF